MENIALFLTFKKGKHGPIHDFLQRKTGRGGVYDLLTYIPNYIYRYLDSENIYCDLTLTVIFKVTATRMLEYRNVH